jgi:hypothetical protein
MRFFLDGLDGYWARFVNAPGTGEEKQYHMPRHEWVEKDKPSEIWIEVSFEAPK